MIDNQKTISSEVFLSGVGLHTGVVSSIKIKPAEENIGIVFLRIDVKKSKEIKAISENVIDCNRGTTIGYDGLSIHTVEHLLSALYGLGIDNAYIEIDNIEPPILDGSSILYIEAILKAGIKEQNCKKKFIKILEPIEYIDESLKVHIKVTPSDSFSISYKTDFKNKTIGKQTYTLNSLKDFKNKVGNARTFCTIDELDYLKNKKLIKGADENCGIVFFNKNSTKNDIEKINNKFNVNIKTDNFNNFSSVKLHYKDEPARHKILDLIGDLSLLGAPLLAHVESLRGGHESNVRLVKKIKSLYSSTDLKFNNEEIKKIIPHREPFLLIDEIIGGKAGSTAIAIKNVSLKDDFFRGHFPGKPIMPGVLILECMAQTSCFLSFKNVKDREKKMMLLSIVKSAKFIKKVVPGDKMIIKVELIKMKLGTAQIKGCAIVNNEIVSKAEFMATMVDKND